MGLVLVSIAVVAAIMLAMALGQRLTGRCLRGSCGGAPSGPLAASGTACDACPLRTRDRDAAATRGRGGAASR